MIGQPEGIFKIRQLTHIILVTEKNPVRRRDAHDMLSQRGKIDRDAHDMLSQRGKIDTLFSSFQVDNGAGIAIKCTQKPPFG